MIEPTQALIFSLVIVLTAFLVLIFWQIYLILSEVRKMFIKFNIMTDSAVSLTQSFTKSIQNLSGFSEGLKAVFGVLKLFKRKENDEKQ